jgi:hypothetical protein
MNIQKLLTGISILHCRLQHRIRRCRVALAYAHGRLEPDQANEIIYHCQAVAGWFPLETLCVDSCLQTALDCHWQPHPELESLVLSACERVASKWSSTGDAAGAAEDWALDLVADYAHARGIELVRHDEPE